MLGASPGKGDREAVEEVHGGMCINGNDDEDTQEPLLFLTAGVLVV